MLKTPLMNATRRKLSAATILFATLIANRRNRAVPA